VKAVCAMGADMRTAHVKAVYAVGAGMRNGDVKVVYALGAGMRNGDVKVVYAVGADMRNGGVKLCGEKNRGANYAAKTYGVKVRGVNDHCSLNHHLACIPGNDFSDEYDVGFSHYGSCGEPQWEHVYFCDG